MQVQRLEPVRRFRLPGNEFIAVIGMNRLDPVIIRDLFRWKAEEIDESLVYEVAAPVRAGYPHRYRRAVGDPAKPGLTFAQYFCLFSLFLD